MKPATTPPALGDVEQTARDTRVAQWGVAAVVMVGSAVAGGYMVGRLGEPRAFGVVIALAVDLALALWIRISARLRVHGITSRSGRVLELTAMAMTLYLNVGAALSRLVTQDTTPATVLLGIAHSFLPITLVLLFFACGDAQLKLLHIRRAEQQRRDAQQAQEAQRQDHAAAMVVRAKELEAQQHERELNERRQARAHEHQQTVATLASQLALATALRTRRPAPRRQTTTPRRPAAKPTAAQTQPARSNATFAVRVRDLTPAQYAELVNEARALRAARARDGLPTGRRVLSRARPDGLGLGEVLARRIAAEIDTPTRLHAITAAGDRP